MTVHSSHRGNRRYSAYVCQRYQKEGAHSCPKSRVSMAKLERFVIQKIREVGRDPRLLKESIALSRREIFRRKPTLKSELNDLLKRESKLTSERGNLADTIASEGRGARSLLTKLTEVEEDLRKLSPRIEEIEAELSALKDQLVEEEDLRSALASFLPLWDQLFPRERGRILHLLIECVTYDAQAGEVEIIFRPGGVKMLREEKERERA